MEKRLTIKPPGDKEAIEKICTELNVSPTLGNLLVQRGITSFDAAKRFFRPELEHLHDPFLMGNMNVAVDRVLEAIEKQQKILVYGDYDVDGTTAVALLYSYLNTLHPKCDFYIPDRYAEGYGISTQGIDFASEEGFALIIALDCGVKAVNVIDYANEKGIDVIVCDHHLPGERLPSAKAILNPKLPSCNYPFKELSGCGIGFKLVQGIQQRKQLPSEHVYPYLDLVAISIACDIVPIVEENRIMCHHGLKSMNENPRPAIKALTGLTKVNKVLSVTDLVFIIGPRINAAGRMAHGKNAVELLISDNGFEAEEKGRTIDYHNSSRKDVDAETTNEALELIEGNPDFVQAKSTVLFNDKWHKGVIGIVASRLIEKHYRPTILLTQQNGLVTGSARSVKGFNIYNAIESCSDLLEQYGGHKYAAGLTLKAINVEAFQKKFEEVVSTTITPEALIPERIVDAEIAFSEISAKFYRILKQFAPFGPSNMKPVFISRGVRDTGRSKRVGATGDHLKLDLEQDSSPGHSLVGIAFQMGELHPSISNGQLFDLIYTIEENEWNGEVSLQLKVKEIRF